MYHANRISTGYESRSRLKDYINVKLCNEYGWDYGYIVAGTSSKKVGKFTYAYMFALYQHCSCRYELHTICCQVSGIISKYRPIALVHKYGYLPGRVKV